MLVDGIAAYRLTRLVTTDDLTAQPRDRIVAWAYRCRRIVPPESWSRFAQDDPSAPKLATLVTCRWCCGVYVGFGVMAARRLVPRPWAPVAEALALASVAVLLARIEEPKEQEESPLRLPPHP